MSYPLTPKLLDCALRRAFKKEANKPTTLDVNAVHDWAGYFGPDMAATNLQRLAVSADSGEAQYVYELFRAGDSVHLTYKQRMSSDEVFPRVVQVGSAVHSEMHGPGQVISCAFSKASGMWVSTVRYHNGHTEARNDPPSAIDMYPTGCAVDADAGPRCEQMQLDWPEKLKNTKNLIAHLQGKLAIFQGLIQGVPEEWGQFFIDQEENIERCAGGGEFCSEPAAVLIPMDMPDTVAAVAHPSAASASSSLLHDPVTHSAFTSAARAALQKAARSPPELAPGALVLLRLKYGSVVPSTHRLPVCLGRLRDDFEVGSVSDGALVSFAASFSSAPDLSGTWKESTDEAMKAIQVPLRAILVSGLSLTTQRKLTQASVSKICSCVAEYDFLPSTTAAVVAPEAAGGGGGGGAI